jgi:hypothetical protein
MSKPRQCVDCSSTFYHRSDREIRCIDCALHFAILTGSDRVLTTAAPKPSLDAWRGVLCALIRTRGTEHNNGVAREGGADFTSEETRS